MLSGCFGGEPVSERQAWMESVFDDAGDAVATALGGEGPGFIPEDWPEASEESGWGSTSADPKIPVNTVVIRCWSDAPLAFTIRLWAADPQPLELQAKSACDASKSVEVPLEHTLSVHRLDVVHPDFRADPSAVYVVLLTSS